MSGKADPAGAPSAPPMEMPQPTDQFPRANAAHQQGAVPEPAPPPYQEAMNYPPAPPYPSYQPNYGAPGPNAMPSHNIYPPANAPNVTYITPPAPPATTIVHHTTTVVPGRANACAFCSSGVVQNETDVCCLLCLILLAIFTFPFGLILLCCVPCTVRKRCNVCRRLYDN